MRLLSVIMTLLFAVFGSLFGMLNVELIVVDFYFVQLTLPKGALLLAAVMIGWLLGGLVAYLVPMARLKRDLRRAQRDLAQARRESAIGIPPPG